MFFRAIPVKGSLCLLTAMSIAAIGCEVTPRGATDPNLAKARDQTAYGATVYSDRCASCHGARGEGVGAPSLMGSGALPEYPRDPSQSVNVASNDPNEQKLRQQLSPGAPLREPFRTAADLYGYVSRMMPYKRGGTLRSTDYWAVVNFILIADGASVPTGGISARNADSVLIPHQ